MIFVHRSPKLPHSIANINPGPGAYQHQGQGKIAAKPSSVFVSRVGKGMEIIDECMVGPGAYFKEESNHNDTFESGNVAFKSKIQRFGSQKAEEKPSKEKLFVKEFNDLMRKQKDEIGKKGVLMDLKAKKAKENELNEMQRLPSIPTSQQSYGYRIDGKTNKLVSNYNPKILFTQTLTAANSQKEDFYFQRSHNSLGKCNKMVKNSSSKRAPNELIHQLSNPNFYTYNPHEHLSIKSEKKKEDAVFSKSISRFSDKASTKKEILKLNRINKDFKQYINANEELDLQKLQAAKIEGIRTMKQPKPPKNLECFMSKQSRFYEQAEGLQKKEVIQDLIVDKRLESQDKKIPKKESDSIAKKDPFSLGSNRFAPSQKVCLGPGSYSTPDSNFKQGIQLKQTQKRFKDSCKQNSSPGPGAYEVYQGEEGERTRHNFSKYRNNYYFSYLKQKEKEPSMEDLYKQVGKHMNYLNKVDKGQKSKRLEGRSKESEMVTNNIENSKKILRDRLCLQNQSKQVSNSQSTKISPQKLKYEPLYHYSKPSQVCSGVGPGYYEIASTLQKRTFNRTANY